MLSIVVVATGMLLLLRQYLYIDPVSDIVITTGEEVILLESETYVAEDGTEAVLEMEAQSDRAYLTFGAFDRIELLATGTTTGARYKDIQTGLEIWDKDNNIVIYEGDTKLFESAITLTGMVEKDLLSSLTENSPWKWIETVGADGQAVRPIRADAFTLTFATSGEVSGTTDCNNFSGIYSVKEGRLSFGSFISTLKGCEQTQETEFTSALAQVIGAAITKEGDLYLELAGGDAWMVLGRSVR